MKEITIAKRKIGVGHPTFVIAEVSCNHHQKYEESVALVKAAKKAGADAVKLQTYTADTMTIDSDKKWFYIGGKDTPGSWKKSNLHALYETAYTPWEWQPKLKQLADKIGITLFSTPFDETAVDFLEKMNVPCFKVASYESTHIPLLKKIARTGKPVIMSIGFADLAEVELSVKTLRDGGVKDLAILHCVTTYTDNPQARYMNLNTIRDVAERFGVVSGFSDNNAGIDQVVDAVVAGANIVEKHLILDRALGGHDARFSIEPQEFKEMVRRIREKEKILGKVHYGPSCEEEKNYKYLRRSIFVVRDMKKGEKFNRKNVRVIRPAAGLESKYFEEVLGYRAKADIERGTPLSWELVDKKSKVV